MVADLDAQGATRVAEEIGGIAVPTNVGVEAEVKQLAERTVQEFGQIDLFCCNAGIALDGGIDAPDDDWQRIWNVNLMSHVYAARAVVPGMLASRAVAIFCRRRFGRWSTTQIGSAPYAVTKHAAVSFAEWLSIRYGDSGIGVSRLCPQGVRTNMLLESHSGIGAFLLEGAVEPEVVAEAVIAGLDAERFLILPCPTPTSPSISVTRPTITIAGSRDCGASKRKWGRADERCYCSRPCWGGAPVRTLDGVPAAASACLFRASNRGAISSRSFQPDILAALW